MAYKPLKIRVEDKDDLQVISACLQDALIPLSGINYDPKLKQLHIVANRFCWECKPETIDGDAYHARVPVGIAFHHVKNVQKKGISPSHQNKLVNLLTIHNPEKGCIHLVFSGGSEIKLEVDKIRCHLKDIDEPYSTPHKPKHS